MMNTALALSAHLLVRAAQSPEAPPAPEVPAEASSAEPSTAGDQVGAPALGLQLRTPDAVERARIALLVGGIAKRERQERLLRGSIGLGAGVAQFSVGLYMLTVLDARGPTITTSGWMNVGVGSYQIGKSLARLFARGPLEKLSRSYAYQVSTEGSAPTREDLDQLEAQWAKAAKGARTFRLVSSGINIAGGLGCLGYAGYLLFGPIQFHKADPAEFQHPDPMVEAELEGELELVPEGQYIVGASLTVTGLLYVATGIYDAILPSPVEAAFAAYKASHKGVPIEIQASMPTPFMVRGGGGMAVSGRF